METDTKGVFIICVTVAVVVASIAAAIILGMMQGTERRLDCAEVKGTWIDGKCLVSTQIVGE